MENGKDFKFGTEPNQSLVSKMFVTIFSKNFVSQKYRSNKACTYHKLKAILNREKIDRSYCSQQVREVVGEV